MTTIQFDIEAQAFKVVNEGRTAYVPKVTFLLKHVDYDLQDSARRAMETPGDVVAVHAALHSSTWYETAQCPAHGGATVKMRQRISLYWFAFQWSVRDTLAAILQDIAESIAP